MNILLLDEDNSIEHSLDCFIPLEKEWKYSKFSQFSSLNDKSYENIDFVIADLSNKENQKLLHDICNKNHNIKTIIISDKLTNCIDKSCEYCKDNYNKKRLFKPVDTKTLYDSIKNYDNDSCHYYELFEDIEALLPEIIKRFDCLEYNEKSKQISVKENTPSIRHTLEFLSLIQILEQNSITYKVKSENLISLV